MLSKVINKIRYEYTKIKRIFTTKLNALLGRSDKNRWSHKKELHTNWNERTKMLAAYIKPNSKVFEFGAGRLSLEKMLPEGCTYFHSDIVERNSDTLVIDLNQELPEIPKVDYVIFSGVLEYIYDVSKLLVHLSQYSENILFSYALVTNITDSRTRRYNGWLNDLRRDDFQSIVNEINWNLIEIGFWKQQTLYQMCKN